MQPWDVYCLLQGNWSLKSLHPLLCPMSVTYSPISPCVDRKEYWSWDKKKCLGRKWTELCEMGKKLLPYWKTKKSVIVTISSLHMPYVQSSTEYNCQYFQAIKAIRNASFKEHFKEMWSSLTRPINVWTSFIAFRCSLLMAQFTVFLLRIAHALTCVL